MPDPFQPEDDDTTWTGPPDPTLRAGLFITDRQLIKRLGVSFPVGYRALRELDRKHALNGFPQKDPLWGNRRLWPKVVRWLMGGGDAKRATESVTWEDRLGKKPPRKARIPGRPGADLAAPQQAPWEPGGTCIGRREPAW
jgi:hypothetical protein